MLGVSLIVSVLAISALVLQRLQNRLLVAASDIEQAQLNAQSAIALGLLTMKQDENWRDGGSDVVWLTTSCGYQATDPVDGDLADDPDDPVLLVGIGRSGGAVQRISVMVDPRHQPLSCLRMAVAAGDEISLTYDTLRASGTISANTITASSSLVDGDVEAVTISGSTYEDTTTLIAADDLPEMPVWGDLVDAYQNIGTEISITSLPMSTPNLCLNSGFEASTSGWTGDPPESWIETAKIEQKDTVAHSGTYSLKVKDRQEFYSGAMYLIDSFVKPGQQYNIQCWIYNDDWNWRGFRISLYTRGTSDGSYLATSGSDTWIRPRTWTLFSMSMTAIGWSGDLEYAFVKIAGAGGDDKDFYLDDVDIREVSTGRYIYRQVLSPSVNPFGSTNSRGVYWIDCGGNRVTIERSRIQGTLVLINPGNGSSVGNGPIHWSPAVPGYPALVVDGDFTFAATDRVLSETENQVNFNPAGAAHDQFGADADLSDIYPSEIQGLVAIDDDFSFANSPRIRGQLIVGDDIKNSSGTLDVGYQPDSLLAPPPGFSDTPTWVRRPGSTTKDVLP